MPDWAIEAAYLTFLRRTRAQQSRQRGALQFDLGPRSFEMIFFFKLGFVALSTLQQRFAGSRSISFPAPAARSFRGSKLSLEVLILIVSTPSPLASRLQGLQGLQQKRALLSMH